MKFNRQTVIRAVSVGASINSAAIRTDQLIAVSAQGIVSGGLSPVGVLKLQASNDAGTIPANGAAPTVTNWSDIPSATIAVGADGVFLIPKTELSYNWIRVVYTRASGDGLISCNLMTLGL